MNTEQVREGTDQNNSDVIFRARPCHGGHVYYNVQYSMDEKHFHCRYGEMQAANRPSFAYYKADNCLSNLCHDERIASCVAP